MARAYAFRFSLLAVAACSGLFAPAHAATLTWDGGSSNANWGTSLNWDCDSIFCTSVPRGGDTLVFAGSLQTNTFNNAGVNLPLHGVIFDSTTSFTLSGDPFVPRAFVPGGAFISNPSSAAHTINTQFALVDPTTFVNGLMTFNGPISLGATLTVTGNRVTTLNGSLTGSGSLVLQSGGIVQLNGQNGSTGQTRVFTGSTLRLGANERIADSSTVDLQGGRFELNGFTETVAAVTGAGSVALGPGQLHINNEVPVSFAGDISGTGSLTKSGTQTLTLSGSSSYTGGTSILQGMLQVSNNALPDNGRVTVFGGVLNVSAPTETIGQLVLNSGSVVGTGALQATGHELRDGTVAVRLTGSGGLNKTTSGSVVLSGANSYSGTTRISGGRLVLQASNVLPDSTSVTIVSGILAMNGFSETVASLSGAGAVELGGGTLTVAGGTTTFLGTISGSGGLVRQGTGTLTLSGLLAYTGSTLVSGGTLSLPNGMPVGGGVISVVGGTLAATGLINRPVALALGGQVTAIGDVTYAASVSGSGSLTGTGTHTLGPSSTLFIALNGTTPITQYDRLVVTSNLVLDGTLSVLLGGGFTPAFGDEFDILDWGTLAGSFDTLDLPALGINLAWNTSDLYLDGTISVAAIPEPESYAMLIAGLGLLGFAARRRRNRGQSPISI